MIEVAIQTLLRADSTLTGYVGVGTDARIRPVNEQQGGVFPRVVFAIPQGENPTKMVGRSGLRKDTIQFVCQAEKRIDARTMADAILLALNGYQGLVGSIRIRGIFHQSQGDDEIAPETGGQKPTYDVLREFLVCYTASA